MMFSADEVKKSVVDNDIHVIPHHECGICGEWVAYDVDGEQLFFNSTCGCSSFSSPMIPRPWQDAADFINLQSDPMVRERVASLFGLAIRHE